MTATLAARDRGMLIIVEQAAQCLTASEVLEVDDVGGASGRLLGLSLGTEDPGGPVQVTAHVADGAATLDIRLSHVYLASVTRTTKEQARVRDSLLMSL